MTIPNTIWVITITLTALITGLYYSYYCSVNPGLGRLSDVDYIKAMQSINIAIQNPVFFASFFGPFVLLPVVTYLSYNSGASTCFYLLLAASLLYIFGSMAVTIFGNVPLNEQLNRLDVSAASQSTITKTAAAFKNRWNLLHNIRTAASLLSFILLVIASLIKPMAQN